MLLIPALGIAQENTRLTFSATTLQNDRFHSYSLNPLLEVGVSDHFNLRYSLGFGMRSNGKFYMHSPVTAPVGLVLFVSGLGSDGDFVTLLGILMLLVPEGVSFDISLSDQIELSPFIDLNSCEYFVRNDNNELDFLFSGDVGLSAQWYLGDSFYLTAHSSAMLLETRGLGFSGGMGAGFSF